MSGPELAPYAPFVACLILFLFGSIPFGLLVARLFKVEDLREKGSGNIGATNVTRVVGFWPAGFLTFLLDFAKGAVPLLLMSATWVGHWWGPWLGQDYEFSLLSLWAAGFFAVLGHCYSPWLHFNGGKGIATGFGVMLVLSPIAAGMALVAFGAVLFEKRVVSLASLSAVGVAAITQLVVYPIGAHLWTGAALVFLIVLRHEANIDSLLQGRENALR